MSNKYLVLCVYFLLRTTAFSQIDGYPNTSLNLQADPIINGAGLLGSTTVSGRGLAFINNPAQLGNVKNNVEIFVQPKSTLMAEDVFTGMWGPLKNDARGIVLGYNLNSTGIPLTVGFGFSDNYFHFYGSDIARWIIEESRAFGIGVKYSSVVDVNLGINIKNFEQTTGVSNSLLTNYDFGVMINVPITKICIPNVGFTFGNDRTIKPKLNCSVGNSLLNVTDKRGVYGFHLQNKVILGYSIEVGFDYFSKDFDLSLFDYSFNVESEYSLKVASRGEIGSKNRSWNLNVIKSLINLEGDYDNIIHKGHIFNICETLIFSVGSFDNGKKCSAYAVSTRGLFKFLGGIIDNKPIGDFLKKVYFEYSRSNYCSNYYLKSTFEGITFGITEVI